MISYELFMFLSRSNGNFYLYWQACVLEPQTQTSCFWDFNYTMHIAQNNLFKFHIFTFFFSFDRPCENMILTLTGFEGRDRDWVKEMIKIVGAKYTSYFTRHNHAIICKRYVFEIYSRRLKIQLVHVL